MENRNVNGPHVFLIILVAIIAGAFVHAVDSIDHKFDVSHISPDERWGDLNNIAARDQFCKSKGYVDSKVFDTYFHERLEKAGGPAGYDIICTKFVEASKTYQYSEYKRWLTSVQLQTPPQDARSQGDGAQTGE